MPDTRDPVAVYLVELIHTASECLLRLPPPGAPLAQREVAIDRILAAMEPFVGDTMLATCDRPGRAPRVMPPGESSRTRFAVGIRRGMIGP
jgi:hypothetical protein